MNGHTHRTKERIGDRVREKQRRGTAGGKNPFKTLDETRITVPLSASYVHIHKDTNVHTMTIRHEFMDQYWDWLIRLPIATWFTALTCMTYTLDVCKCKWADRRRGRSHQDRLFASSLPSSPPADSLRRSGSRSRWLWREAWWQREDNQTVFHFLNFNVPII